jgi:acyl dehydratase
MITMNHHPLHIDAHDAAGTQFGRNLVVGNLVYSLALGMSVADISGKAIANLQRRFSEECGSELRCRDITTPMTARR